MIKNRCDQCGADLGIIIETTLFICSMCLIGASETEIEQMIAEIKGRTIPKYNDFEIQGLYEPRGNEKEIIDYD
jgi:CxxC motif-containing protein